MLLPDELAMLARCQAATPGPWENVRNEFIVFDYGVHAIATQIFGQGKPVQEQRIIAVIQGAYRPEADGNLIAHARTDLPLLLQRVAALREALDNIAHREPDPDLLQHKWEDAFRNVVDFAKAALKCT